MCTPGVSLAIAPTEALQPPLPQLLERWRAGGRRGLTVTAWLPLHGRCRLSFRGCGVQRLLQRRELLLLLAACWQRRPVAERSGSGVQAAAPPNCSTHEPPRSQQQVQQPCTRNAQQPSRSTQSAAFCLAPHPPKRRPLRLALPGVRQRASRAPPRAGAAVPPIPSGAACSIKQYI